MDSDSSYRFKPLTGDNYYIYDQYGDNNMLPLGPIGIISLPGTETLCQQINQHLVRRRTDYIEKHAHLDLESRPGFLREDYIIDVENYRFSSGEGKSILMNSVRGHDLFIVIDVLNHSQTYKFYGMDKPMSPDEHYINLKRVILAAAGKAKSITVFMNFLYEGRQHKKMNRESLDCANMLQELIQAGVTNIITFDAHDPRIANAIPYDSFEDLPATYQMIKGLKRHIPTLSKHNPNLMVISPDEGAIPRAMYYASMLGSPMGTFYKRRDYTRIVNGRNPIINHEFLGEGVEGRDVLIVDDMISSGDSIIDIAYELKKRKAEKVYCAVTFGLFCNGLDVFNDAYEKGIIDKVFCSDLIYRSPELLNAPWFEDVQMSKFMALIIDAMNHDASISKLINPTDKINKLLSE